jgi:hypothetical protein
LRAAPVWLVRSVLERSAVAGFSLEGVLGF